MAEDGDTSAFWSPCSGVKADNHVDVAALVTPSLMFTTAGSLGCAIQLYFTVLSTVLFKAPKVRISLPGKCEN